MTDNSNDSVSPASACDLLEVKSEQKDELVSVLKNVTPQNFTNRVAYDICMELKEHRYQEHACRSR